MVMTFAVLLTCRFCKATLRYENERPEWKTYDVRVDESDKVEKAAAFVTEHADDVLPQSMDEYPDWANNMSWDIQGLVSISYPERRVELRLPPPSRYVECPICDKRIWEPR